MLNTTVRILNVMLVSTGMLWVTTIYAQQVDEYAYPQQLPEEQQYPVEEPAAAGYV